MALLFESWLLDFLALVVSLFASLYVYFTVVFGYWEKRGVPFLKPSFPFGNLGDVLLGKEQYGILFGDIYNRLAGHKVGGVFQLHRPTVVIRDLDTIKSFLVKDFANFHDRGFYFDEKNDPLSAHLVAIGGQKWRNLRAKMTPTFTTGKMKMMFGTILECGQELAECMHEKVVNGETPEIKDLVARYTTDVIATCAFGIQCNSLKNPASEFRLKGKEFFSPGFLFAVGQALNVTAPSLAAVTKLGLTPKHISDFFRKVVKETVEYRETNNISRNDFMHLLLQLKNKGYVELDAEEKNNPLSTEPDAVKKLTLDEISAQAFFFFLAGFETSSTTVSFCLHELALNRDIQTRLSTEIDTVLAKHGGQMSYEAMQDMEYLAMVIDETLRMYPPLPILNRECNAPYTLPGTGVVIEKGVLVVVPVYGLHHDPLLYPEPEKFDPERFGPKQKASRNSYSYLPFGEGPRICIGMRFGYMQTKIALISLLRRFEFRKSENTIIPHVYDTKSVTLATKGGLFLKVVDRV